MPIRRQTAAINARISDEVSQELRAAHQAFHEKLGAVDTHEKQAAHEKFHKSLEEKIRHLRANLQGAGHQAERLSRVRGHSVDVPGLAKFCFAVPAPTSDRAWLLGPGQKARVVVTLHTDPQVSIQEHRFKILVDSNDRSGQ